MSNEPYRIVTPQQYHKGYTIVSIHEIPNTGVKQFELIRKLEDGNYLVKNPQPPASPTEGGDI